MKKILCLTAALALSAVSLAYADGSPNGNWFVQAEGGLLGIPISSQAASIFSPAFGGEAQVGYAFSREFSLSVESGFDNLPVKSSQLYPGQTSASSNHIPLEAVGQFNINAGGGVWPYVVVGVGIAFDSNSSSPALPAGLTTSWTNFELDPGIGVAVDLSKNINIFVQGKLDMDFAPTIGANAESLDNPVMVIPVEVGLNLSFM
jgi:opacity protein-like surface antigen